MTDRRVYKKMTADPSGSEVLYGIHPVRAALEAGRRTVKRLFCVDSRKHNRRREQIIRLAEKGGLPVEYLTTAGLDKIAGSTGHQGLAAEVSGYPLVEPEEVLAAGRPGYPAFILVIDGVVDPHNLGALARTAACVGVDGIIITKNNAVGPTPAVSKTSAGAIEFLTLARATNLVRTIDFFKKKGIWVAGLDAAGQQTLYESDLAGPLALVVGGEEKGMRQLVRRHCDFVAAIPQAGAVSSLNVSVAGGIAMYEVFRQRL
ncbi:MAG: 23S rRNA (guanosine(2251)-2'-O)-methyltransferase RlmB [Desulfosudaceae bacterium]